MLTYLDARSLVAFAKTSHLHNHLAGKKSLWMALLALPWAAYDHAGQPIGDVDMETETKAYYAARRLHAIEKRAESQKDHAGRVREVRENHRAWWCLLLSDVALLPCIAAFNTIFFICLVYQLTTHQDISMLTLWPILAICALLTLVATVMCCMKWLPEPRWNESHALGLPRNFYESATGPIKIMMEIIGSGKSLWAHATFCMMSMVLAVFTVFVVLQVAGYIHWSWWHVFTPLYIVFASFCCAPCLKWYTTPDVQIGRYIYVSMWAFRGLPLLCFTLLLNIRLADEHAFSLAIVLIPLWVLDAMVFCTAVAQSFDESSLAPLCGWMCQGGASLVFKILLACSASEGGSLSSLSKAYIFIPLYIQQFALLFGSVASSFFLLDQRGIDYENEPAPFDVPVPPV